MISIYRQIIIHDYFLNSNNLHLRTHRHQQSPCLSPLKLNSCFGVERSFPLDLENSKNSEVTFTQTI